jgi:hypothetical protein
MERVRRSLLVVGVVVAALAASAPAGAHPGHRHDGLIKVRPRIGPPLLTHGRDPVPSPAAQRRMANALPDGVGFSPGDAKRSPVCASDYYQHVLYARPEGSANRADASRDQIRNSVKRTNAVLNAESRASGGGNADYKVLCNSAGEIEVSQFASSGSGFSQIVASARASGFDSERADYLIYYDANSSGACGTASFSADESLSINNSNNSGGDYAVIWADCWETFIPMHEGGHMMGAVQYSAPHSTGSGSHCNEENDVMCYSPDGGDRNQGGTVQHCGGEERFDCGFDDYFDAAPEQGEYLASHWNLGSPLNRFITFGRPDPLQDLLGGVQSLLGGGKKAGAGKSVAGGPGSWRHFKLELTRPARALRVKLTQPPNAPLTLYVRRLKQPTASEYSCRARSSRTTVSCRIRKPRGGRWFAGVASTGTAGTPFRISAKLEPRR